MDYGYLAYVDEAGDPGLTKVRPIDENGASEWLVVSAVVMRTMREPEVVEWVDQIRGSIGVTQRRDLHFRKLSLSRRADVAEAMTRSPIRAFAVCPNKKNMRGYRNPRAEKIDSQQWFYNWCLRLLLERVTAFCAARSQQDYGKMKKLKVEFSERGGHRYSQTRAYHWYLSLQQEAGGVYLQKRQPVRGMLHHELMFASPHGGRAGLQLADVVASAFYQAIDCLGPGQWSIDAARTLAPIMAKENHQVRDFGVALFPTPAKASLTPEQQTIFIDYGYSFARW